MRQFYEVWRDASEELVTLLRKLLWSSHVDLLGRCKTTEERAFYLRLALHEKISIRELRRAIDTASDWQTWSS